MAISPTGPHPVTNTLRPAMVGTLTEWTALPKFSWSAATDSGNPTGSGQALAAGTTTYSAKAPSRCTPRISVAGHR